MRPSHHLDSAQLATLFGSGFGYLVANYDRLLGASCALCGLLYTIWKWRQEALSRKRDKQ